MYICYQYIYICVYMYRRSTWNLYGNTFAPKTALFLHINGFKWDNGVYPQKRTRIPNKKNFYLAAWCLTPNQLLMCLSFSRENGHPLFICSSLSTSQLIFREFPIGFSQLEPQTISKLHLRVATYETHPGIHGRFWSSKSRKKKVPFPRFETAQKKIAKQARFCFSQALRNSASDAFEAGCIRCLQTQRRWWPVRNCMNRATTDTVKALTKGISDG